MFLDSFTTVSPKCFCSLGLVMKRSTSWMWCCVPRKQGLDCFKSRRLRRTHNKCYLFSIALQASRGYHEGSFLSLSACMFMCFYNTLLMLALPCRMHVSWVPWRHHCSDILISTKERPSTFSADPQIPRFADRDSPSSLICLRWKQWCKSCSWHVPGLLTFHECVSLRVHSSTTPRY